MDVYQKLLRCFEDVKNQVEFAPLAAIVLGSGLGAFAQEIKVVKTLNYSDIEGFPVSTVPGHKGRFVFGYVGETPVVIMQGRVHYYEGYSMEDVVLPTRLMAMMGAKSLLLTNASGGINPSFRAGDFMLVKDHISSFVPNPLRGKNLDELGTRFPDMSHVYSQKLNEIIKETAKQLEIPLKEGVYVQLSGPSFETPAEIKMLGMLGADAVGMSTVVEAVAANHAGMEVCAISCVANLAAGMTENPLTHEEVQQSADKAAPLFKKLVKNSVENMGKYLMEKFV